MKKIVYLAVLGSALISAPAFAGGGKGLAIGANVLTGSNGVLGLLSGRGGLVINASVTTGKGGLLGGLLGTVLGRGGLLGGSGGGGCGCR